MRFAWVAVVVVAMAAAGGCTTAAEQKRAEKADRISASRLGGKFYHDDPLVQMLSLNERQALQDAGMMAPLPEGVELGDNVAEAGGDDEPKDNWDKAGDVAMSVLSVGITLGMMAAPYLLF